MIDVVHILLPLMPLGLGLAALLLMAATAKPSRPPTTAKIYPWPRPLRPPASGRVQPWSRHHDGTQHSRS